MGGDAPKGHVNNVIPLSLDVCEFGFFKSGAGWAPQAFAVVAQKSQRIPLPMKIPTAVRA